jgi:hypothetical protein
MARDLIQTPDDAESNFFIRSGTSRPPFLEHTMIKKTVFAAAVTGLLLAAGQASATLIDFNSLSEGTVLSNQYAGVTFSANAFTGLGGPTKNWATNTDMTITGSLSGDAGNLGLPSLVSGNLLRALGTGLGPYDGAGWLAENGDPSFSVTFSMAISSISVDFAGVSTPADVRLIAYNGTTLLGEAPLSTITATPAQFTLSFSAASITKVAIVPGSFLDWVGVDNINYTTAPVPEVSTYAMMALGMGLLAFKRRKVA